ncbi:MAG: hypothetical protein M3N51_11385 [Actinomycetota bacterium]|nr:hypothetical protein [Actinomycetota bacterium]
MARTERCTDRALRARTSGERWKRSRPARRVWRDQRPASTQETGMTVVELAASSTVVFSTLVCFIPSRTSPSTMSTGWGWRLSANSSGTLPPSPTSLMATVASAAASA